MTDVFFYGHGRWIEVYGDPEDPCVDEISDGLTSGVFSLSRGDEITFRHTGTFHGTTSLYPSNHADSAFLSLKGDGNREQFCVFMIDTKKPIKMIIAKSDKPNKPKTELPETERQTMLKLIFGMAINAYDYDPRSSRNKATGDKDGIKSALETQGLQIDTKTIKKYLDEAKELYAIEKPTKN